ncbi:phosphoenolpyruvate--protein phosphotransferase [soil metagenome]
MSEGQTVTTPSTTDDPRASAADDPGVLTGRGAAPGVAIAPAALVAVSPAAEPADEPAQGTPEEERRRAEEALDATEESLLDLAEKVEGDAGADEAAIFEAHADFAADPELLSRVRTAIDGGASAAEAVRAAFDGFGALLAKSTDEYIAARAADIGDVRDQVVAVLRGEDPSATLVEHDEPVIVVAHDLTPSQTARIPSEQLAGIACEEGSPTAHSAILARALGIPSVVGVTGLLAAVERAGEHATLAIDGTACEVIVDPGDAERDEFSQRIEREAELTARLAELVDEPGQTADGRHVELAANVNDEGTLEVLEGSGAQGAGLVRTELLFVQHTQPPTVDEQVDFYARVLAAFPGERVVIRTSDIGADKPVPYIELDEENPALGVRGLRLALDRREMLVDQLTALVRAAAQAGPDAGRLAIMFPMVSRPDELDTALAVVDEVCAAEGADRPEMGVMIEVPAAALAARRFAQRVDFLSLGTNDLLQYLFAADRVLAGVAHLPDICDPDVLRLIRDVVDAAHAHDAWVGVCGEAAADPVQAAAFVGLGMDELSMTPSGIGRIKDVLRRVTSAQLADAVARAIDADGPDEARQQIADTIDAGRTD